MKYPIYFIISVLILSLSYRIGLFKVLAFSIFMSAFILISEARAYPYESTIFVMFILALPFIAERFRRDFNMRREELRSGFGEVRKRYEELMHKDRSEIESNLEREKRLQRVLSLYEISKDMSAALAFEDILNIFSSTLKKSFRFRLSRLVILKQSKDIEEVYQIELGQRTQEVLPDDFDRGLVDIAFEIGKPVLISPYESSDFLRRLSILKDFETLISIPLFAEGVLAGVLYIENIPRLYFENFSILADQFAIQFQKAILYKKIQEMSITDSLTEVNTRRYFLERFSEEIRRSMRRKTKLSFLMLDLDHFKEKNDKFGHLVGDVILKDVAGILKSNLREIDIIGRYGGEEFAIVLADTERDGAFQVAGRLREGIEGAVFKAYDERVSTTVSIGISVFPDDGVDMEDLIERADKALYKAKESGRNKVC